MFGMFGMTSNLIMLTSQNISDEVVQFNFRLFKSICDHEHSIFSKNYAGGYTLQNVSNVHESSMSNNAYLHTPFICKV